MKRCPFCNVEITDDAIFCPECGRRIAQPGGGDSQGQSAPDREESPGYYGNDDYVPGQAPLAPPPAKKKAGKWIGIGAGLAAAAAAAVFAGVRLMAKEPKDVVFDAFKSVYSSEITYPAEEVFGWKALMKRGRTENMEGEFSLALEQCSEEMASPFIGTGFSVVSQSDIQQKRISAQLETRIANMDFVDMDLYLDQEELAIAVPKISRHVFTVYYGNDLEGQIDDSPVAGELIRQTGIQTSAINDYMDYIWSIYDAQGERPFDLEALWTRYKEGSQAIHDLKEAITVEKTESASYTIDGKTVKCRGYHVVIPQQAMIDFADTTSQFLIEDKTLKDDVADFLSQMIAVSGGRGIGGMSAKELQREAWDTLEEYADLAVEAMEDSVEDITMTVYVDKKGRLAAFEAETSLDIDGEELEVTAEGQMRGGSYVSQNADWDITIRGDGGKATISASEEGEYNDKILTKHVAVKVSGGGERITFDWDGEYDRVSGDYSLEFSWDGDVAGSLTAEGAVSDLKPGEAIYISADEICFKLEDGTRVDFSGGYGLRPLEGEAVRPKGEIFDVLAADEMDWQEAAEEAAGNIETIMDMLNGLLYGASFS